MLTCKVFVNPTSETKANRDGIVHVISRMKWLGRSGGRLAGGGVRVCLHLAWRIVSETLDNARWDASSRGLLLRKKGGMLQLLPRCLAGMRLDEAKKSASQSAPSAIGTELCEEEGFGRARIRLYVWLLGTA